MNNTTPYIGRNAALNLIRAWQWFAYVPGEAHEWLADRARHRHFAKGDHVYRSGDPASHIFGVVSGELRIYSTTAKGYEVTDEELVAGSWFPHMVTSRMHAYYGNCICQEDAVVVKIAQADMAEFSRRWPGYYQGLYHEMTDRSPATTSRIVLLSCHSLDVRLAVYLLRAARFRGTREGSGAVLIPGEISQAEVGARVGGTRQRVNMSLKNWEKRGLIELGRYGTRIIDIAQLSAEATKSGFELEEYLSGWHGGWQGKPACCEPSQSAAIRIATY